MKRTILTAQHDNGDMVAGENFKRQLLTTLTAVRNGDFSSRLPSDLTGLDGKVADAFNEVVGRMERFGEGVSRLRNEVGRRGRISERLSMGDSIGGWAERIESINSLVDDLSQPTVEIRERQKLEALVLNISEREQQRIGQDLHDGLCQQLTGIKFRNRLLAQKLAEHGSPEVRDAQEIEKLLIDAIEQARNQALGLLPVRLEAEGLRTALQELAASITCFFGVECVCTFPDPVSIQDHGVAIHFYRIAQEAITNAIKHGKAGKIEIRLVESNGDFQLQVHDNGTGLPAVPQTDGMGLHIMNYRARTVGAVLDVQAGEGGGTLVTCTWPRLNFRAAKG